MDINQFITDNFTAIMIIVGVIIMTLIGYIAKKTGFGAKISSSENKENIKSAEEQLAEDISKIKERTVSEPDNLSQTLDTITSGFNDGNLVIGDVNQNPDKTNEDLGISEDLYAPFGDENDKVDQIIEPNIESTGQTAIEELKIEDVGDQSSFNIIENNTSNDDEIGELEIKDVDTNDNNPVIEELKIEDIPNNISELESSSSEDNPIVEEINDLVDNTFVINDATEDFIETEAKKDENISEIVTENSIIDDLANSAPVQESVIANFDIGENEFANEEIPDFEVEKTTSLKLDEINEKIKNLKLEDIDNQESEEEIIEETKKKKKKKKVSVKSVDEIKNETKKNNPKETEDVIEMDLPNLDEVSKNTDSEKVTEEDDIWKF